MANVAQIAKNVTVAGSNFRFTRSDGQFMEMPKDVSMQETGLKRRVQVVDRLRRDGGTAIGDESFQPRQYIMRYHVHDSGTISGALNTIESFFRPDKRPYYLTDVARAHRAEIVLRENKIAHDNGLRDRVALNCSMTLEMVDALWESLDEFGFPGGPGSQTGGATTGGTGTGTAAGVGILLQDENEFTITNTGLFDAFPLFYVVAQNNVVSFTLRNLTADGAMTFDHNSFLSGALVILDSVAGTITIDGVDRSAGLSAGGLLRLLPGANTFRYESDGGDVRFEAVWRTRHAY